MGRGAGAAGGRPQVCGAWAFAAGGRKCATWAKRGGEGSAGLDVSDRVPHCPPGTPRPHSPFLPTLTFHSPCPEEGPSWQPGPQGESLDSRTELSCPGAAGWRPRTPWAGGGHRNLRAGASGPTWGHLHHLPVAPGPHPPRPRASGPWAETLRLPAPRGGLSGCLEPARTPPARGTQHSSGRG